MNGMINLIRQIFLGANIVSAAGMVITGYSYLIDPAKFTPTATLGIFFPIFLAVNLFFLFFWLIFNRKAAILSTATLMLCYFPMKKYIGINIPQSIPEETIKVMTYNVLHFHGMQDHPTTELKNEIADFLVSSDCDILCLQEANEGALTQAGRDKLKGKYPYSHIDSKKGQQNSIALYSKYPVLWSDTIAYKSEANISVAYILMTPVGKTLVINNHLESNHLSIEERNQFRNMVTGEMKTDSVGRQSKSLLTKLTESTLVRNPQAKAVAAFVAAHKGMPVILCGDFNETPISFTHHIISKNLTDCFVSSGIGPGWSYCHSGMRVRIDNIMCSEHFKPYGCKVLSNIHYSDHYPMICWLKPRDDNKQRAEEKKFIK